MNNYFLLLFFCAYFMTNQPWGKYQNAGAKREKSIGGGGAEKTPSYVQSG